MHAPRAEPALPAFRRVLAKYADAIESNWDGAIAGQEPEFLHRLRVAVRRTRATLESAKGVVDTNDRRLFGRGLKRIATATSDARDYDVAAIDWPKRVAELDAVSRDALAPVHVALVAHQHAAHERMNRELRRRRTRRFMKGWQRWLAHKPKRRGRRAGVPVGAAVDGQRRKLTARMDTLVGVETAEARHALRKSAKRLRYLVDGFASLFDDTERTALIDRLVAMQDELGRGRDAIVQAQIVRSIVTELPASKELARATDELLTSLASSAAEGTPRSSRRQDAPPRLTPSNT